MFMLNLGTVVLVQATKILCTWTSTVFGAIGSLIHVRAGIGRLAVVRIAIVWA